MLVKEDVLEVALRFGGVLTDFHRNYILCTLLLLNDCLRIIMYKY